MGSCCPWYFSGLPALGWMSKAPHTVQVSYFFVFSLAQKSLNSFHLLLPSFKRIVSVHRVE
jgi:hypothetical protein